MAFPAIVVIAPGGEEVYRWASRDFAFRLPEDELLDVLRSLDLEPTTQDLPVLGPIEAGPRAMPVHAMAPYYRGAKFAGVALGMRHPDIQDDIKLFSEQMDRYMQGVRDLKVRLLVELEPTADDA